MSLREEATCWAVGPNRRPDQGDSSALSPEVWSRPSRGGESRLVGALVRPEGRKHTPTPPLFTVSWLKLGCSYATASQPYTAGRRCVCRYPHRLDLDLLRTAELVLDSRSRPGQPPGLGLGLTPTLTRLSNCSAALFLVWSNQTQPTSNLLVMLEPHHNFRLAWRS